MKRKLLIAALSLGTLGGFASGFASLACRGKHRRHTMEQKVENICAGALDKALDKRRSRKE